MWPLWKTAWRSLTDKTELLCPPALLLDTHPQMLTSASQRSNQSYITASLFTKAKQRSNLKCPVRDKETVCSVLWGRNFATGDSTAGSLGSRRASQMLHDSVYIRFAGQPSSRNQRREQRLLGLERKEQERLDCGNKVSARHELRDTLTTRQLQSAAVLCVQALL